MVLRVSLIGCVLVATFAPLVNAGGREPAIRAASHLSKVSYKLFRFAAHEGYPRTAHYLRAIAQASDHVEEEARFGLRRKAGIYANRVIRLYLAMQPHLSQVSDPWARRHIRLNIHTALNGMAIAIFEEYPLSVCAIGDDGYLPSYDERLATIVEGNTCAMWDEAETPVVTPGVPGDLIAIPGHALELPPEDVAIGEEHVINPANPADEEW